ncbi:patatin-like phospholipase family protein [Clostridium sp. 'White wine YQ']|uniref:patatin-like phospholipase family protein n=1 Tax=Clostridium sp. 'White wine YQ' TaxID=3027474 RepID=UPI00236504A6|nr:patatin family protein [Clostridium sp. 'White wine YQ']MDD7794060.1 patatin family protein [Clostridium sp. 'White wine YQ']
MKDHALILEGGGMRGVYTAGVLEYFLEKEIRFPYVIGVSAGASYAFSYISGQKGRNKRIFADYIRDKRYLSLRNYLKEGSLFGMNFIYDVLPNELEIFDYKSFRENEATFYIGVTDVETGEANYYEKNEANDPNLIVRASSSLPIISPIVHYEDRLYLDGALADPLPIEKAIKDGYDKFVVVLTRNAGYRKPSSKVSLFVRQKYRRYPNLLKALEGRSEVYNRQLELIEKLEKEGKAIVIRPSEKLQVERMTKNREKLVSLYKLGYEDCKKIL